MLVKDVQIRFTDIDMLGHVGNTVIQQYYDMGKMGYFAQVMGMPYFWKKEAFIVVSTATTYAQEIKADEKISITTRITKVGTKSVTFLQEIIETQSGRVKGSSESVLVAFNLDTRTTFEVHSYWREKIALHEGVA